MRTKEVREAIERVIKEHIKPNKIIQENEYGCARIKDKIYNENDIKILLSYIEKLETEEDRDYTTVYMKGCADKDTVWRDKINKKIKELKTYIYEGENAPQDFLQYRIKAKIQALEELEGE